MAQQMQYEEIKTVLQQMGDAENKCTHLLMVGQHGWKVLEEKVQRLHMTVDQCEELSVDRQPEKVY